MSGYAVCYCCYLQLRKFRCNKTIFGCNFVIRRQAQRDGELKDCNALVTIRIFVPLNFVTLILESLGVASFGNMLNSIGHDFIKNSMPFPMV